MFNIAVAEDGGQDRVGLGSSGEMIQDQCADEVVDCGRWNNVNIKLQNIVDRC